MAQAPQGAAHRILGLLGLEIDRLQHGADALAVGEQRLRQLLRRPRLARVEAELPQAFAKREAIRQLEARQVAGATGA
ncbi:hypothetical protein QTI33_34115 [Variovorax sp. J22P271]|uniref:hypothetical protein n=1 Tax=Variovorax davisae TaxID=3053515 RepID=UPI002578EB0B|nr:hypothetical protein [Variovorax sp. J22P271]MDM0037209.1 hypothetical protein [Variovorax sp. J22P271]